MDATPPDTHYLDDLFGPASTFDPRSGTVLLLGGYSGNTIEFNPYVWSRSAASGFWSILSP